VFVNRDDLLGQHERTLKGIQTGVKKCLAILKVLEVSMARHAIYTPSGGSTPTPACTPGQWTNGAVLKCPQCLCQSLQVTQDSSTERRVCLQPTCSFVDEVPVDE
jgi:hypothetical protein